jgi:acetate kinase
MSESTLLAVNCGSSSLKFDLYRYSEGQPRLLSGGEAEEIGRAHATFRVGVEGQAKQEKSARIPDHDTAFATAWQEIVVNSSQKPRAIGHRIVHGGPDVRNHQLFTKEIGDALKRAAEFAPLHVPTALSVLDAAQRMVHGIAQVICLDTAFHRTLPDVSRTLPLPQDLRAEGVERYGFHGLSLESILAQLKSIPERLVIAHLGNGSSITAVLHGKSIDTTMAFTPNAGLMMGTRCGDLDPGVATYLARHHGATADTMDQLLNKKSGLLGVSGYSSDVRDLMAARSKDSNADLALRMFCYQVTKQISAMAAALGGIEMLVFTGGIGEHAADIRSEITDPLGFLGKFQTLVLPAQENLQIAKITARLAAIS